MKRIITIITALVLSSLLSVFVFATEVSTEATEISTEATEENTEATEESTEPIEKSTDLPEDSTEVTEDSTESTEEFDFEAYLTEKIAPVCVGVATSLIALIGTIGKVKASLTSINSAEKVIKEVKDTTSNTLSAIKSELTDGIKEMGEHVCQIDEIKEGYEMLKAGYEQLLSKNKALMEAIKLGFASMPDAVESGAARKIAIITGEESDGEE